MLSVQPTLAQLIKDTPLPPAYVYVASLGRYGDAVTGRFVALKVIFNIIDANEVASVATMKNLGYALLDGSLPQNAWYLAMQQQLRRLSVQNAALAAGGLDALKTRDLARLDHALQDDWRRLVKFSADIMAGKVSRAQIASRVEMYAGHARMQYYAGLPKPRTKPNQVVLERRVLGIAEHCSFCIYLVSLGWQPYGTLPLPGQSDPSWDGDQCFTNCHCDIERQVFSRAEAATLVQPLKAFFAGRYSHENKGGAGSGNHDHAGIPGHQGGSQAQSGKLLSNYKREGFKVPAGNDLAFDEALEGYNFNGHPLTTLYLGKQDHSVDSSSWLQRMSGDRKGQVVGYLAKGTGMTHEEANDFIKQWAKSSNDHEMASLGIQEEAAKLFGTELTAWQKDRIEGTQAVRNGILSLALDHVPDDPDSLLSAADNAFKQLASRKPGMMHPFEPAGFRKMIDDLTNEVDDGLDLNRDVLLSRIADVEKNARQKTREAIGFIYNETQRKLKAEGITEMHVYRGAGLSPEHVTGLQVGQSAHVQSNPLSSWSLSKETASEFAELPSHGRNASAVVFDAIVPASRVYATPVTGQGCLLEWEVVVIGSHSDRVRVYAVNDDTVKALIKGGEGSGNFGHHGRPGERGGSAAATSIMEEDPFADDPKTKVTISGDTEHLVDFGLTQADIEYMTQVGVPGATCKVQITYHETDKELQIEGIWDKDWSMIGHFDRFLNQDKKTVKLEMLSFYKPYLSKGLGVDVARRWYSKLADAGYEEAHLFADLTVGKYAWAKEGAQYEEGKRRAEIVTLDFAEWAKERHVTGFEDRGFPTFHNPQEVANYQHPDGYTMRGDDIKNKAVPADMTMHVGKAFMLDDAGHGHGSWDAVIDLKNWKGKGSSIKASTDSQADDNAAEIGYVEVGQDVPGGSDAAFWSQYLTEEEGDPVFGFGEQFGKSLSIKGGEGSGYFNHDGRPGERGGSAASNSRDRVWHGQQHIGEPTLNKLQTGSIGEKAVIDVLSQLYGVEFGTVNVNVNNAPFDVAGDSLAVEVKTGLATNGKSAHHWRATIGQPGKEETELLKQMTAEEKRAHNEWKSQAILDRKHALLAKMSKESGHTIKPMTVCLILKGDGKAADIFQFDDFHLRLPWNKYATDEHYLGTYDVDKRIMHWKNPPTGKAAQFVKSLPIYNPTLYPPANELLAKSRAAVFEQVSRDFEQVYQWWVEHVDSAAGTVKKDEAKRDE